MHVRIHGRVFVCPPFRPSVRVYARLCPRVCMPWSPLFPVQPLVQRDSSSSVTSPKHHVDALCGKAGQKPRPMIRVIHPSTSDMHDNLPPELRRRIMADDRTGDSSEDDINHNYSLEEEMNAAHAKEDEDNDGDDDTASASQTDSGGSGDDYMEDDDDDDDDDDDKTGSGEDAVSSGEEFSDGEEDEEASGSDVSLSQVFAASRRHDSAEEDFDEEEDDEEAEKLLGLKPLHAFITPRNSASPTLDGRGDTAIHDTADRASHQDETTGEEDEDAGGDDDDEKSVIAESTEPENRVPTVPVIEVVRELSQKFSKYAVHPHTRAHTHTPTHTHTHTYTHTHTHTHTHAPFILHSCHSQSTILSCIQHHTFGFNTEQKALFLPCATKTSSNFL